MTDWRQFRSPRAQKCGIRPGRATSRPASEHPPSRHPIEIMRFASQPISSRRRADLPKSVRFSDTHPLVDGRRWACAPSAPPFRDRSPPHDVARIRHTTPAARRVGERPTAQHPFRNATTQPFPGREDRTHAGGFPSPPVIVVRHTLERTQQRAGTGLPRPVGLEGRRGRSGQYRGR